MSKHLSLVDGNLYDIVELTGDEVADVDGAGVVSNVGYTIGFALTGAAIGATIASGGTLSGPAAAVGGVGVVCLGIAAVADYYGY